MFINDICNPKFSGDWKRRASFNWKSRMLQSSRKKKELYVKRAFKSIRSFASTDSVGRSSIRNVYCIRTYNKIHFCIVHCYCIEVQLIFNVGFSSCNFAELIF